LEPEPCFEEDKLTFTQLVKEFPASYGTGILKLTAWSRVLEKLSNFIALISNNI
jgi:hypothetical protein